MLHTLLASPLALGGGYAALLTGVIFRQRAFLFGTTTPSANRRRRAVEIVACMAAAALFFGVLAEAPPTFFAVVGGVMGLALAASMGMPYAPDPATQRPPRSLYGPFAMGFAAVAVGLSMLAQVFSTPSF